MILITKGGYGKIKIEYMQWFFTLACSGLGEFLACFIIVSIPFTFVFKMWNRYLRQKNIEKHGYPPPYCDADGDLKDETDEEEEDDE